MKTKDVSWKDNRGIQNNGTEEAQKNIIEHQRQY